MHRQHERGPRGLASWLWAFSLVLGCSHVDHHSKCPPPGDCVGYPSGLCAGYYPTCWRVWPAECPSCPVEPAPAVVPGLGAPPLAPGEAVPNAPLGDSYLDPEGVPTAPAPAAQPQTPPLPAVPPTPRAAGRRLQPIRSRPVPRIDDSTSAGPPPRPLAQAAPVERGEKVNLLEAPASMAVRVVSEVRPLPPVQEVPAVRPAATRVEVPPPAWGELVEQLPPVPRIRMPQLVPADPRPSVSAAIKPAVRPAERRAPLPGVAMEPIVRPAGPIRR